MDNWLVEYDAPTRKRILAVKHVLNYKIIKGDKQGDKDEMVT